MCDPARFTAGPWFKSFTGLAPRASETGNTDRKGHPMSKAGSSLLRATLVRAADHARKQDPQLARIYWVQMVEPGANHLKALCDVGGTPVTPEQAKAIIAECCTVPAQVRARRRSRKTRTARALPI